MRLFRSLLVGSLLVGALMSSGVSAASAHDELLSSSPSDGEQLAAAPAEIRLEFASDVLAIGALVLVVDEAGRDWAASDPALDGTTVVVTVGPDLPVAGYQVRWRVIGADGHPISGVIPFTIGDAAPMVTAASEQAQQAAELQENPTEVQAPEGSSALLRTVFLGIVGAAIAAGLFLLFLVIRQRKPATARPSKAHTQPAESHEPERHNPS